MQTLIHGLRTFSQVMTKAQPFVSVDLQAVAQEVVSDLQGHLEQVGGRVDVGELPTIEGEPFHVKQLFQHLIDNALKFRQDRDAAAGHHAESAPAGIGTTWQ